MNRLSPLLLNLFAPDRGVGRVVIPALAIAAALLAGAIFVQLSGHDPLDTYASIGRGALGVSRDWQMGDPIGDLIRSPRRLGNTATEALRLMLMGLAIALPLHTGLINIGGMGQMITGGLLATVVGLSFGGQSVLWVLAAGLIGGAVWGALAGIMRAYRGMNEIITTIMLNFIAFWINAYLVKGVLRDPKSIGFDWSAPLPDTARMPFIGGDARISAGLIVALLAALMAYILLWHTTIGFEWRVVGKNPSAAYFAGMPVKHSLIGSMALAGGLAGLAGALIIAGGDEARLTMDFAQNYGFDGIPVAFIGQAHPFGVVLAGLFFGALRYGSETAETFVGVPQSISQVILGLAMLFIVVSQSLTLVRWLRKQHTLAILKSVPEGD